MKKILAFVLCMIFAFGTLCIGASAAEESTEPEKVYALTMGIHKYSVNNTVTDGAGVASLTFLRHSTGEEGSQNKIFDVKKGEKFTLTTKLNDGMEKFYSFVAWVDGKGVVLGTDTSIEITVDSSVAVFATYAETATRYMVTYSHIGEGNISVSSNMPMQQGDGCVSVLEGADVTFKFTPAENFSVYTIKLDGRRVDMLTYSVERFIRFIKEGEIKTAFEAIINFFKIWLGKEGVFEVENVETNLVFEVGFMEPYFKID